VKYKFSKITVWKNLSAATIFFANFLILEDINKMIISHITTKYSDTVFSSSND